MSTQTCGEVRDQWHCSLPAGHVLRHAGWWRGVLREWPQHPAMVTIAASSGAAHELEFYGGVA